jgi:DNA end-binding protein Ku
MEVLFYPEDVRAKEEIEDVVRDTTVTDAELAMAKQLVESLAQPFDPDAYENEHKKEVLALIERKLAGEEVPVAVEGPAPAPVPDLMGALKASLEQAKAGGPDGASRSKASGNGTPENGAAGNGDDAAPKPKRKRAAAKSSD